MLTNPPAGATALVAKSPGMVRRRPSTSLPVWPRAKGTPSTSGMSGSVSLSPTAATISRLIHAA